MNIIDILILVLILYGVYKGFKYGGFSAAISLFGSLLVFVLAYFLKNPISTLLYENLPFFSFGGVFSGISSVNILIYEGIAYAFCIFVLSFLLKVILKVTGIVDKFINLTFILTIPSKILGLLFGGLQYYIYAFILVFVIAQLPFTAKYYNDSEIGPWITKNTPILSNITNDLYYSVTEIYDVCANRGSKDREEADKAALEILLKYEVITPESAQKIQNKGKFDIKDIDDVIDNFKNSLKDDKNS